MLFNYKAVGKDGQLLSGSIDTISIDAAIASLQHRGFAVSSVVPAGERKSIFAKRFSFFSGARPRLLVILSRQMATLFEAEVPPLRVFQLLAEESTSPVLNEGLLQIADDVKEGSSISKALSKHPNIFSNFYVSMVRSGEETGKLNETFTFLADHIERAHQVTSKATHALIYPAFVIAAFVGVTTLLLTTVIPKLSAILREAGQEIPFFTRIIIGVSDFFVSYGFVLLFLVAVAVVVFWRWGATSAGKIVLSRARISVPYVGNLYRKLYLARIADTLETMLSGAVPIVKALEVTAEVVGNVVYEGILKKTTEAVKGGSSLSLALEQHEDIPGIMVQMVRVGEESGELGSILKTLARFYHREVTDAVDTLVGLIEPLLILGLGLGVGTLIAAVLIPIYNISAGI